MIVYDSLLLNHKTLNDLASFGLPIILIRDPMLLPASDSCLFVKEPNIILEEINPYLGRYPIVYFANKILNNEKIIIGNYDTVSIINKKQLNLYNLQSSDMTLTLSNRIRNEINNIYREKILKNNLTINNIGEKLIVSENMYNHKIIDSNEKKLKIFLTKGLVGNIGKIYKHSPNTRFVPMEFIPDCYHESFTELILDRYLLNNINLNSHQVIPDEIFKCEYAYALTPILARNNYWNKVLLLIDNDEEFDEELLKRFIYTAVTRSKKILTIVI